MKEVDVQILMQKLAAAKYSSMEHRDGHDSDAELHSDSLHPLQSRTPCTPPKTPACWIGSVGTQDTEATVPSSITADSHTDPAVSCMGPGDKAQRANVGGVPSPMHLAPELSFSLASGPTATPIVSRLSLDTPVKRELLVGQHSSATYAGIPATIKEEEAVHTPRLSKNLSHFSLGAASSVAASPQLSQDSSVGLSTTQLSKLGLASPCSTTQKLKTSGVTIRPTAIEVPQLGLDDPSCGAMSALSALCSLASTPTHQSCRDQLPPTQPMHFGEDVEPSPRKRPRRNVERRNWSTLSHTSSGSSNLGEAHCLDDDEEEPAASNRAAANVAASSRAHALLGAKSSARPLAASDPVRELLIPGIGKASPRASQSQGHGVHHSHIAHNNLLLAVSLESPRRGSMEGHIDEDEDEEIETPEDEEDDEEWSPRGGDWSPRGGKVRGGAPRGSPGRCTPRGKALRPYVRSPLIVSACGLLEADTEEEEEEIELPVDVTKGGKIPELIRSKRAASGFVGVDFHEGKWRARVRIGVGIRGQPNRLVIGRYTSAGDAAIAYSRYVNSSVGKKLLAGGRG